MISRVAGEYQQQPYEHTPLSVSHSERPATGATRSIRRVATVLEYVEENHSRSSCRLEEVARTLRVSRSYLSRLVLRETGLTFNRHLQLARMNTAARLLQASSLSVKEISAATGYEHVPSFDRQFRKHFRMTPGEFRRGSASEFGRLGLAHPGIPATGWSLPVIARFDSAPRYTTR